MIPAFALHRPTTVAEAVDELAAGGMAYCGGTELLPTLQLGFLAPDVLVDLKRVAELGGITDSGGEVVIGARVTHDEAEASAALRRDARVLTVATAQLGNARVRATGTVAGNVCFAEPRSDVLTALFALDARVDLRSAEGSRSLPIADFVHGAFTTARDDGELLAAIRIPKRPARSAYVRFQPSEYPTVSVAAVARPDECVVVVGAVGERPQSFAFPSIGDVPADDIAGRVEVMEDLNGREDYKRHLTSVFVRRAVAQLEEDGSA